MSMEQEVEITIERGKEYFEELRKHCKNIEKIIAQEKDEEISRPVAQKLLAQNIIQQQTDTYNFLEQSNIKVLIKNEKRKEKKVEILIKMMTKIQSSV